MRLKKMLVVIEKSIRSFGWPPELHRADRVWLTVMYWREYRTEFHIGLAFGVSESIVCRTIQKSENSKNGEKMKIKFLTIFLLVVILLLIFSASSSASGQTQNLTQNPNDNATMRWRGTGNPIVVARNASAPCRAYCVGWAVGAAADGYALILKTEDSGITWKRQGKAGAIPNINLIGISALDEQHAWAVGGKIILSTRNGGLTWAQQTLPKDLPYDYELFQVKALDKHTAFAVGSAGVLLSLKDDRRTVGGVWTRMPTDLNMPTIQYSDVDAVDASHVWAVGGVVSGIDPRTGLAISFYDGIRWQTQLITHSTQECSSFIGVSAVDKDTAWAVGGPNCPPYRTVNGGASWRAIGKPVGPGLFDTNRIVAVTRDLIWVTHDNGIYRTTDGGRTWEQTPVGCGGMPVCYAISAAGTQYAWSVDLGAPSQSHLFRWVNGKHWKSQSTPGDARAVLISFVGARR